MSKVPVFHALTPEAVRSLGNRDTFRVVACPFRVGRESRGETRQGGFDGRDRRRRSPKQNNDLYLYDDGAPKHISREHFEIDLTEDGTYTLADRGSACGMLVGSRVVGGRRQVGRCPLAHGDVVVVGTSQSPYIFRFLLEEVTDD